MSRPRASVNRITAFLSALVLGWSFLFGFIGHSPSAAAEEAASSLAGLVARYLTIEETDQADALLARILEHPDASLPTLQALLAAGPIYQTQPVGRQPGVPVFVRGRWRQYALSVPASYQPTAPHGLVVCLHGAGFTGEAYLERWESRLGEKYILACPTLIEGTWWTRTAEDLVLATIESVRAHYRIDTDRIFLTGMSNGGIGTYLVGAHHAPLFAGVAPMASGLDTVLLPFLENLRHTPMYLIHGRRDQIMPVELSRTIVEELKRLGIAYVYREHDRVHPMAGGHFFPREELPQLVTWFDARRREAVPKSLSVVRDASHLTPFGWVRIDATDRIAFMTEGLVDNQDETMKKRIYARLQAEVTQPNRIEVRTHLVRRYSLYLNETLVDLSKPVTIVTNGRPSYEGVLRPSAETLLRDARFRRDPQQLYPVLLTIAVEAGE